MSGMNELLDRAIAAIGAQQPKERGAVWMVGEQLKDMLRAEPELAGLIAEDLEATKMSLADCEKKIAERAKQNMVGSVGCVTPAEAEEIIRKFYGLPEKGQKPETNSKVIDLADFL